MNQGKRFRLVHGAKNAAIYDLESGKVYSINDSGKQIILNYLSGNCSFEGKEQAYLDQLHNLGIVAATIEDDSKHEPYEIESGNRLVYAWLELTEKCNCNCIHCYGQWGDAEKNAHKGLSKEYWISILDEIYRHGGRDVQLIGGEPLLHADFADILRHAHQIGMQRIDVFTNATLIDEKMARLLKENGASVRVSLYGHCAELHEKVTQRAGSFSKTEHGLKLLKNYEIPTKIAVVVMDVNENHIADIRTYIESLGLEYNGYDTIRQAVGGNQISHCVDRLDVLSVRYQKEPRFKTTEDAFNKNHCINTCWYRKLAFAANGDVYPCIFARDFKIGNIKEDSFDDIFSRAQTPWTYSLDYVDECKECEFRYACRDCRPLAQSLTGNPNGKFPRCTYNPKEGVWEKVEDVTVELKVIPLEND